MVYPPGIQTLSCEPSGISPISLVIYDVRAIVGPGFDKALMPNSEVVAQALLIVTTTAEGKHR